MKKLLLLFAFVTNTCLTASTQTKYAYADPTSTEEKDFGKKGKLNQATLDSYYNNALSISPNTTTINKTRIQARFEQIGTVGYDLGYNNGVNNTKIKYELKIKEVKEKLENEHSLLSKIAKEKEQKNAEQTINTLKTQSQMEKDEMEKVFKQNQEEREAQNKEYKKLLVSFDTLAKEKANLTQPGETKQTEIQVDNKMIQDLKNNSGFFSAFFNKGKITQVGLTLLSLYFIISGTCFTYFSLAPLIGKALGK